MLDSEKNENLFHFKAWYRARLRSQSLTWPDLAKYALTKETKIYLGDALLQGLYTAKKEVERITGEKCIIRHYLTIEDFMSPRSLLDYLYRTTLAQYTQTEIWHFVYAEVTPEALIRLIFHHSLGDDASQQYMSLTDAEYKTLCYKMVTTYAIIHSSLHEQGLLPVPFDGDRYVESLAAPRDFVATVTEGGQSGRMLLRQDLHDLADIKDLTHTLMERGQLEVFLGFAGTGKSHVAVQEMFAEPCGPWYSVTLSNTVGMEIDAKVRAEGLRVHSTVDFTPLSITAYRMKREPAFRSAIIDEFSQWQVQELPVLKSIMEHVLAQRGKLFILGDTNQMRGFLSRGSLLRGFALMVRDGGGVVHQCTTIRRVADADYKAACMRFLSTGQLKVFTPYMVQNDGLPQNLLDEVLENGIIVTGMNKSVDNFNAAAIARLMELDGLQDQGNVEDNIKALVDAGRGVRLICKETKFFTEKPASAVGRKVMDCKQLCNEKCRVIRHGGRYDVVFERCDIKGKPLVRHFSNISSVMEDFSPGYAITVNRAQGLGWDTVIVNAESPNITTFEALYVAMTRCKKTTYLLKHPIHPSGSRSLVMGPYHKLNICNHFDIQEV